MRDELGDKNNTRQFPIYFSHVYFWELQPATYLKAEPQLNANQTELAFHFQCTVGSDEKFQIPGQEIIFEISGPGPSYLSIGTSQDHIWSYFEHMCWSAQVECGGV